jgi:hypothetical protein
MRKILLFLFSLVSLTVSAQLPDTIFNKTKQALQVRELQITNPAVGTAGVDSFLVINGKNVKKVGPVTGADSSIFATRTNVNTAGKTYPQEKPLGVIYEQSTWNDLSPFQISATGVNTLTVSGGYVNSSVPSGTSGFNYHNSVKILHSRPTNLNKWKMTMQFAITAYSSTSYEFGMGIVSRITGADLGFYGFLQTTNSGSGNIFIYDEAGGARTSGSGITYTLNDVVEQTLTLNDTIITFTARNVTTGGATSTISWTYPTNQSTVLPNMSNWSIFEGNDAGVGTHQIRYLKIESLETQAPNLLIIGNSKTKVGFASSNSGRYGIQLNSTYRMK